MESSHSCMSPREITSSAPKGSSSSRMSALHSDVRRKAARWRMPPDRLAGYRFSQPARPNSAKRGFASSIASL